MKRGDIGLLTHPHHDYLARHYGLHVQVVGVELSLLGEVVDEPATDIVNRLRIDALPTAGARHWRRTVDYLGATVLGDEQTSAHPLILGQAGRLLAACLIAVFDPSAATEHACDRADATSDAVRRAIAYMETNPDLDISVADIARASFVGIRALQLAFRRHLDTTPLAYLRKVRLDQARAELAGADPDTGVTVTDIAARWGFSSSSRFARQYRATYNELPSRTLRGH